MRAWTEVSSLGWGRGSRRGMGDGDFAFAPAELEGLRSGKWRWLDTVVGRVGDQVGLKYRQLLCG